MAAVHALEAFCLAEVRMRRKEYGLPATSDPEEVNTIRFKQGSFSAHTDWTPLSPADSTKDELVEEGEPRMASPVNSTFDDHTTPPASTRQLTPTTPPPARHRDDDQVVEQDASTRLEQDIHAIMISASIAPKPIGSSPRGPRALLPPSPPLVALAAYSPPRPVLTSSHRRATPPLERIITTPHSNHHTSHTTTTATHRPFTSIEKAT